MPSRPLLRSTNGMVATGHGLATTAGIGVLREGGNAVDAAIAAAAVADVVLPYRTGFAGDLFALVYESRSNRVYALNASGSAPALADPGRFGQSIPTIGASAATVPGVIAGLSDLLLRFGSFDLARLLRPAIGYARNGFPVSEVCVRRMAVNIERLRADSSCAATFLVDGEPPTPGAILVQADLADTLEALISRGWRDFYEGELASRMSSGIRNAGGLIRPDDLAHHESVWKDPLQIDYRGFRFYGQPPVSQGHVLLEELAIVSGDDLRALAWASADLIHLMVEAKKLAFADRDARAGDVPGFDALSLLEPALAGNRRARIGARASGNTTYLATADRDGNAVSLIQSVFGDFGAAFIPPGTGLVLNNRLSAFSLNSSSPNAIAGGKRPVHTLNAVIATVHDRPCLIFGTPGAEAQVQTSFQLSVALADFSLDPQTAIDAPRWLHERGRRLLVERRYPAPVISELMSRGHQIELLPEWSELTGGAQVISIDHSAGIFSAGADPRREGAAAGF